MSFGWWVIRYCEGGTSENQPQSTASVCVRVTQEQREPLTLRCTGLDKKVKMGTPFIPLPHKPKPDGGEHCGRRLAWQADRPAKLPVTSQKFQASGGSTPAGTPTSWVPTSVGPPGSLAFSSPSDNRTGEGLGPLDPRPDAQRRPRMPWHHTPVAISATSSSGSVQGRGS